MNESLSPRLQWLRDHGVEIKENLPHPEAGAEDDLGRELWPWYAFAAGTGIGGATPDEALVNLCKFKGWKLWNEL